MIFYFYQTFYLYYTVIFLFRSAAKTKSPERPVLPPRPTISAPQAATGTRTEHDAIAIKKEISKPTRPPPPPKKISGDGSDAAKSKSQSKPQLPPRPKSHSEVVKWWRDNEFDKGSGLDDNKKPLEWFHGIFSSLFSYLRFKCMCFFLRSKINIFFLFLKESSLVFKLKTYWKKNVKVHF